MRLKQPGTDFSLLTAERENIFKYMLHLEQICRESFSLSQSQLLLSYTYVIFCTKKTSEILRLKKTGFLQIYRTLHLTCNDVMVPDETVSWGKKVQIIS